MGIDTLVPYLAEAHLTVNRPSTSSHVDHAKPRAEEPGVGAASDADEHEMRDLEDILSKINPRDEEFIPPSLTSPVGARFAAPAPLSLNVYGYYPTNVGFAFLCLTHRRFSYSTVKTAALLRRIPYPTAVDAAAPLTVAARHLLSMTVNSTSPSGDHYKSPPFNPFRAATVSPSTPVLPLESPLLEELPSTAPPEEELPSSMAVHQEATLACQEVELQGLKAGVEAMKSREESPEEEAWWLLSHADFIN
jgi:hypothetical protein